jgi:hypothetical protein
MSAAVVGFRLREEWAAATLREAREAAQVEAVLVRVEASLLEASSVLVGAIVNTWTRYLARLERTGAPAGEVAKVAQHTAAGARDTHEVLALLRRLENRSGRLQEVDDLMAVLDRVAREAESVRHASEAPLPPLDLERTRRGIEQMERGEGEDVETILARVRAGGAV